MTSQPDQQPGTSVSPPSDPVGEPPGAEPGVRGEQTGLNVCPACGGNAAAGDRPCPTCDGTGTVREVVGDA